MIRAVMSKFACINIRVKSASIDFGLKTKVHAASEKQSRESKIFAEKIFLFFQHEKFVL